MTQEQKQLIEKLYKEHYPMLYSYAMRITRDSVLTENLIHDTFLVAIKKIHDLISHPEPSAWLWKTLKYSIIHYYYVAGKTPQILPIDRVAEELLSQEEALQFSDFEDALTEEECVFFRLYYQYGCSHRELGQRFGISVSASQKRLERIRMKIKAIL